MTSRRIPALALTLAAFSLPSVAQTTNPLGSSLPLTVHALAGCIELNNQSPLQVIDEQVGAAHASCTAATNAEASADVSSGSLRVTVASQTLPPLHQAGLGRAALYDRLTFAGMSGPTPITLNMSIHGSFSPDPFAGGGDVFASMFGSILASGVHLKEGTGGGVFLYDAPVGQVTTNADPITGIFPSNDVRIDLSRTFTVSASTPDIWFLAQLSLVSGGANETMDFGHTALLSLDLPPGVTYTSASGLFLTEGAAPVPEPEAAWLLFAGLIPLAARLRWNRRRAHQR